MSNRKEEVVETPLMKQYNQIKSKYPGAILLFRVGDFYETFGEDAVKAAQILGIVLTKRANGAASHIELAGFPHHALDTYLPKLVRAGQRVAICDQLEDPKLTKKIVKRGVTELVTPGVSYNDKILDNKANNYLAVIHYSNQACGVAFLDISTGEFMTAEGSADYIEKLIQGFRPSEIIVAKPAFKTFISQFGDKHYTYQLDDWVFQYDYAFDKLISHFKTINLKGYGIQEMPAAIIASGVCLHYLQETQHNQIAHIQSVSRIEEEKYVWLDRFTIRNLELLYSPHENGVPLVQVVDRTVTPMGARMLKKWMVLPLKEPALINERLDLVELATRDEKLRKQTVDLLKQIGDLERLISKVAMRRINPRELQTLHRALKCIEPMQVLFNKSTLDPLLKLSSQLADCSWVIHKIEQTLKADPPLQTNRGDLIQDSINQELDELRKIAYSGKDYLLQLQLQEQQRTGIPSLKVAYNNVFGYYLEVTHTHKHKVPEDWIRKQTLTNAERYITGELKEYEEKILGAEEKIFAIEEKLFHELVLGISEYVGQIQQNALVLSKIDCLFAFAALSVQHHYTRPLVDEGFELQLKDSRHPVIEQQLPKGETYISNDIFLDRTTQQVVILTGPNMSGKSALLRQTALNVILAQMGCFVACSAAKIGVVDKIFTRVGASDNISSGESTFMVEMTETASILNNISERSLILLDEIGRGTSTYDGVSIAWSIAEYIYQHPAKPKTLFATHYHELNELESKGSGIKNYHIEIKEFENKIIFLRKLKEGGSEHSFGIHVAKMAGVPQLVIQKASAILAELEKRRHKLGAPNANQLPATHPSIQLSMFQVHDPVLEEIKIELDALDVNRLSPVEALIKLNEFKQKLNKTLTG